MQRNLELSLLVTALALLGAATAYLGAQLAETPFLQAEVTARSLGLTLAVAFLAASTSALALSVFARFVAAATAAPPNTFWGNSSLLLQDFALWLIVRWLFFWGIPVGSAMWISSFLSRFIVAGAAAVIGLVMGLAILIAMVVVAPGAHKVGTEIDPFNRLTIKRGLVVFFVLFGFGFAYATSRTSFDVQLSPTFLSRPDTAEIRVRLGGRLPAPQYLVADVFANDAKRLAGLTRQILDRR